jgi:tryptophan-rich sensory protein
MLLNFAWSPTFFAAQRIDAAFGIILLMFVAIVAFVLTAWSQDRVAALLFLPYAAWVGFASALNGAILMLNRAGG